MRECLRCGAKYTESKKDERESTAILCPNCGSVEYRPFPEDEKVLEQPVKEAGLNFIYQGDELSYQKQLLPVQKFLLEQVNLEDLTQICAKFYKQPKWNTDWLLINGSKADIIYLLFSDLENKRKTRIFLNEISLFSMEFTNKLDQIFGIVR